MQCTMQCALQCALQCAMQCTIRPLLCALQVMLRQRQTLALVRQQQQAAMEADANAHGALDRTPGMAVRLGRLVWALLLPLRSATYRSAREGVGAVQRELAATRKLLHHQLWALSEMCDERERAAYATTLLGRWNNLLGLFFAGYGTYKVIFALASILYRRLPSKLEPMLFRVVAYAPVLERWLGAVDVSFWSQAISLTLVGVMSFSSVRGFLIHANRLGLRLEVLHLDGRYDLAAAEILPQRRYERAPPSPEAPLVAELLGCLIASIMGYYFLSSVLLVRTSLPQRYRAGISEAVGPLRAPLLPSTPYPQPQACPLITPSPAPPRYPLPTTPPKPPRPGRPARVPVLPPLVRLDVPRCCRPHAPRLHAAPCHQPPPPRRSEAPSCARHSSPPLPPGATWWAQCRALHSGGAPAAVPLKAEARTPASASVADSEAFNTPRPPRRLPHLERAK